MAEVKKFEFGIYKKGEEIYRTELNAMEQSAFEMGAGLLLNDEKGSEYTLVKFADGKEVARKQISEKVIGVFTKIHDYNWDSKKATQLNVVSKDTEN